MASPIDLPYTPANVLYRFTIAFEAPPATRYFTDATISDLERHGSTICNICHEQLGGLSADEIQRIAPDEATAPSTAPSTTTPDASTDPPAANADPPACARPSVLSCGHVFGRACLKEWLGASDTCPLCRAEVSTMRWTGDGVDGCSDGDSDDSDAELADDEDFRRGYLLALEGDPDSGAEGRGWARWWVEDEEGEAEAGEGEDGAW